MSILTKSMRRLVLRLSMFLKISQALLIAELVKAARNVADMTRRNRRKNSSLTVNIFQKPKEQLVLSESQLLKK